jgi:hypothetical protein
VARVRSEPKVLLKFRIDAQPYQLGIIDEPGFGLTPREAGRVKRLASGAAGVHIMEALGALDAEVIAALAVIAAARAGVEVNEDAILDGKSDLEFEMEEASTASPLAGPAAGVAVNGDSSPTITPTRDGIGVPS